MYFVALYHCDWENRRLHVLHYLLNIIIILHTVTNCSRHTAAGHMWKPDNPDTPVVTLMHKLTHTLNHSHSREEPRSRESQAEKRNYRYMHVWEIIHAFSHLKGVGDKRTWFRFQEVCMELIIDCGEIEDRAWHCLPWWQTEKMNTIQKRTRARQRFEDSFLQNKTDEFLKRPWKCES